MAVGQGGSSRSGPGSRFAPRLDLDLQMRSGPPASWTWTGPVRFGPGSDPVQAVLTRTLDSVVLATHWWFPWLPCALHQPRKPPTSHDDSLGVSSASMCPPPPPTSPRDSLVGPAFLLPPCRHLSTTDHHLLTTNHHLSTTNHHLSTTTTTNESRRLVGGFLSFHHHQRVTTTRWWFSQPPTTTSPKVAAAGGARL